MAHNALLRGHASMTTCSKPCAHHEPSSTLNTVALMPYLKEISLPSLTTFTLTTSNAPQTYTGCEAVLPKKVKKVTYFQKKIKNDKKSLFACEINKITEI